MRIAVVGSRDYPSTFLVRQLVKSMDRTDTVVSGGGGKVDLAAEKTARRAGMGTDIYLADWKTYGKAAGVLRNGHIAEACDCMVAFWDGKSRGTADAILNTLRLGKPVRVVEPNGHVITSAYTIEYLAKQARRAREARSAQ
jgi:hypothetical protein